MRSSVLHVFLVILFLFGNPKPVSAAFLPCTEFAFTVPVQCYGVLSNISETVGVSLAETTSPIPAIYSSVASHVGVGGFTTFAPQTIRRPPTVTAGTRVWGSESLALSSSLRVPALPGTFVTVSNQSDASLPQGTLALKSQVNGSVVGTNRNGRLGGSVGLQDILTFTIPAGQQSSTVTMRLHIDGEINAMYSSPEVLTSVLNMTVFGQRFSDFSIYGTSDLIVDDMLQIRITQERGSVPLSQPYSFDIFTQAYFIFPTTLIYGDLVLDFGSTGRLSLDVSSGTSWTSASGVFLAVPEVASSLMLVLGLLSLRFVVKSRSTPV